ncbi:HAD-IIIA family hydrolase [Devosia sp.]|uniref:D-glycero-alpha-D-manno-heptose-1,7-bisphosphate 7-phosphatase n=1 Tax=Devosia sp. TaxID=1871048 RepID=UPI0032639524
MDDAPHPLADRFSRIRAIALDRDGTINVDVKYPHRLEDLQIIDGFAEFMAWAAETKLPVSVITNQSGIARGYYDVEAAHRFNAAINASIAPLGLRIEHFEMCPHLPDAGCTCRKPATGMLENLSARYGIAPNEWVVFGDQYSDIECASRFGALSVGLGAKFAAPGLAPISPDLVIGALGDFPAIYRQAIANSSRI